MHELDWIISPFLIEMNIYKRGILREWLSLISIYLYKMYSICHQANSRIDVVKLKQHIWDLFLKNLIILLSSCQCQRSEWLLTRHNGYKMILWSDIYVYFQLLITLKGNYLLNWKCVYIKTMYIFNGL